MSRRQDPVQKLHELVSFLYNDLEAEIVRDTVQSHLLVAKCLRSLPELLLPFNNSMQTATREIWKIISFRSALLLFRVMLCHATLCCGMSCCHCFITPFLPLCCVMLCYVVLCYIMLRYAVYHYVLLHYVTSHDVLLW